MSFRIAIWVVPDDRTIQAAVRMQETLLKGAERLGQDRYVPPMTLTDPARLRVELVEFHADEKEIDRIMDAAREGFGRLTGPGACLLGPTVTGGESIRWRDVGGMRPLCDAAHALADAHVSGLTFPGDPHMVLSSFPTDESPPIELYDRRPSAARLRPWTPVGLEVVAINGHTDVIDRLPFGC